MRQASASLSQKQLVSSPAHFRPPFLMGYGIPTYAGGSPVEQDIMLPTDEEYRALLRCYQALVTQLDYRSVGPRLVSHHVVDLSQHDRIRSEQSEYARNEAFLSVLMTKCSKVQFGVFLRILEADETLRHILNIIKSKSQVVLA